MVKKIKSNPYGFQKIVGLYYERIEKRLSYLTNPLISEQKNKATRKYFIAKKYTKLLVISLRRPVNTFGKSLSLCYSTPAER